MALQTAPSGYFRPVGSDSFGNIRQKPAKFDQQPVEATATIAACLAAARADRGAEWPAGARRAFDWFLGDNDLQRSIGRTLQRVAVSMGSTPIGPTRTWVPSRYCRTCWPWSTSAGSCARMLPRLHGSTRPDARSECLTSSNRRPTSQGSRKLSQPTFFNRQALYLRPDPARVIVRPFKPATEPRDFNRTDKTTRQSYRRPCDRTRRGDRRAATRRRPGEFRRPASEPARHVRGAGRRNGRCVRTPCGFHRDAASPGRRLFPARVFIRSIGAVQSEHRAASRSIRSAEWRMPVRAQPTRRRRRPRLFVDIPVRNDRC